MENPLKYHQTMFFADYRIYGALVIFFAVSDQHICNMYADKRRGPSLGF